MLIDALILLLGLAILLAGGETLVRGASSLARGLGVSPLAIGLTVVAFGTSAPELAVNVGASLGDARALSFGNIFGSNMANIGLIVGLVAVINPLPIQNIVIRRELPMLLLSTAAVSVLAFDLQTGSIRTHYDRTSGVVMLLFFIVFLYYTVGEMLRPRLRNGKNGQLGEPSGESDDFSREISPLAALPSDAEEECTPTPSVPRDLLLSIAGLAALIWGADLTVDGAVSLARAFDISEVMIGLTVVALGTSLPELATAMIAIRHNKIDLAVGGVVGSNIFNTLLVAGVTSCINPMPIPTSGYYDLAAVAGLSLYLTLVGSTHRQRVIRYEGLMLLGSYLGYITWRTVTFTAG